MKNNKNQEKEKVLKYDNHTYRKEEEKMGRGYFGLPKRFNVWFRLIVIWLVFGGFGIYFFTINQFWAGIISLGVGLMFSLFNNFLS